MATSRNPIAAVLLAAASGAAAAHTAVRIELATPVHVAPAPLVVAEPARVAAPGHWEWQGDGHVWVPARTGVRAAYAQRDRDGAPDRFDRAPFNPCRY